MKTGRVLLWIVLAVLVVIGAGIAFLMVADVPPPVNHVERVIPNDRLGSR